MKATLTGIAAALALTSMSAVYAQDHSVQIKPITTSSYHLWAEDFNDFKKTYLLENGDKIAFSNRMNSFYTQLEDGERMRIYPVSRNVFMTESGARIEFREQGETVGVTNFEKLSLAGKLPANTVMASASR
jgi:hypothetical protein